jgi:hypothetical protein
MNKAAKIIVWSLIGIGAVTGIYFGIKALLIAKKNKDATKKVEEEQKKQEEIEKAKGNTSPVYTNTTATISGITYVAGDFPLKQGSYNKALVGRLQTALNEKFGTSPKLIVDGAWGALTQAAMIAAKLGTDVKDETALEAIEAGKSTTSKVDTYNVYAKANLYLYSAPSYSSTRIGNLYGANKLVGIVSKDNFDMAGINDWVAVINSSNVKGYQQVSNLLLK